MQKVVSICSVMLSLLALSVHAQTFTVENKKDKLPPPQLGISPPNIDESLKLGTGKAINKSIVFYNYSPKPKEISIRMVDVDMDKKPIEPSKLTLSPWTILNPTTFTIPSNGQQTIRLSIRPPLGFPERKHHSILLIQQNVKNSVTKNAEGVVLNFGSSYALPVTVSIKTDSVRE